MLKREEWLDLARNLDWDFSYVSERDVYPELVSGSPWLTQAHWNDWNEPYKTSYSDYVTGQHSKEAAVRAVREAIGGIEDFQKLDPAWLSSLKLHAATLPLAEFTAVIANLRAARFGRDSAWRTTALFGALDELRHTQIPLMLMQELIRWDVQFDWTHKFFHTNNWIALAGRHLMDEMILGANPIEFAVATNFVFETGFTNLQFIGLSAAAHSVGDRMFEKMVTSIQTDEARHAQIGPAVLRILMKHDPEYAQFLVDKWFWRNWLFFSIVTGFSMDYLTPVKQRVQSFREFLEEWVLDQFDRSLVDMGLKRPWYWDQFLEATEIYHHMVYVSAYTYRATTWFDFPMPAEEDHAWLEEKYPATWPMLRPVWSVLEERWKECGPDVEWYTQGWTPIGFCRLCQLVLCGGTPQKNTARLTVIDGTKYIFCSEPCEQIFRNELGRYASHKDIVMRILAGEAPGNLLSLLREYFGLTEKSWGKSILRTGV